MLTKRRTAAVAEHHERGLHATLRIVADNAKANARRSVVLDLDDARGPQRAHLTGRCQRRVERPRQGRRGDDVAERVDTEFLGAETRESEMASIGYVDTLDGRDRIGDGIPCAERIEDAARTL